MLRQDDVFSGLDSVFEVYRDNEGKFRFRLRAANTSNILASQGCRVGCWSMIQTGCRFRRDIPPYIVAAKEPTSYYGINAMILEHEGYPDKVIKHMSHAYRIIYQGNTSIFDALLMVKDQVPMSDEIQHIIDFISESKLGIIH